jgi:Kef-type K+ transport system membrane component KefB
MFEISHIFYQKLSHFWSFLAFPRLKKTLLLSLVFFGISAAYASSDAYAIHSASSITILWIALILISAKVSGFVEKIRQPAVLGELLAGVILGNLYLFGFKLFEPIKSDAIISFLAELGVIILLFQIGLESNIAQMKRVGFKAFLVAVVGVLCPFALGTYIVGPLILPGLSFNSYLFLGAMLTATSVGITARVFKDLGKLQTKEAQIVLGAAVIDDVLGLVILAIVSAIVSAGSVSLAALSTIIGKSILFLFGAILIGQWSAPYIGKLLSRIHTGTGMKFAFAVSFGLIISYLAGRIGLAPIVGAFAAGLVLDPVHFKTFEKPQISEAINSTCAKVDKDTKSKLEELATHYSEKHVEHIIEPIGLLLVPIFFVTTGMGVKIETLFDSSIFILAVLLTITAFVGKIASGLVAGNVNKKIVGFGMVPRGEVDLIFAVTGKTLGVVNDQIFSAVVVMIILTALLTPPILTWLIKNNKD